MAICSSQKAWEVAMGSDKTQAGMYTREDGSTGYRRTIRINGRKIQKKFSKKKDADNWYAEKKREKELIGSGLQLERPDLLVSEFSDEWLKKRKANGKPQSSWESDEQRLRKYIVPHFGDRVMDRIATKEWEDFLDDLVSREEISPATRNRIRSIATKMYNDAMRRQLVRMNPVSLIPKLKESMDAWDYWHSAEEVLNYLSEAENECDAFKIFAYLALNTGARICEILAFQWSDFNIPQRRVHIAKIFEETSQTVFDRTKGHTARWLGINEVLATKLLEQRSNAKLPKPSDYLIVDKDGKIYSERKIRKIHARVCKKAELKEIRIHDLRHTYASHYVMNGGGLAELQMLLGHSTPQMTQKYAHLAPGFLESKAKVVSFAPSKNSVVKIVR